MHLPAGSMAAFENFSFFTALFLLSPVFRRQEKKAKSKKRNGQIEDHMLYWRGKEVLPYA